MSQIGKRAEQKEEENQRDCTEPEEGEKEYYRKLRVMHYRVMQMVFNATRSSWRLARVCVCARAMASESGATNDHGQARITILALKRWKRDLYGWRQTA